MATARDMAQFKLRLKQTMGDYLYGPFEGYYQRELEAIIEQNDSIIYGADRRSWIFTYKAVRYCQVRFNRPPQNIARLCPSLHLRMDSLLDEKLRIERDEKPLVMGYVMRVLNSSADVATVMQAFPSSLKPPIEESLTASGLAIPTRGTDEAGHSVHASDACIAAVKMRLMTNLLLATR